MRIYRRILKCGCMISSDGGGGLIPCYAEWGDDEEAKKLHNKCWKEWKESEDYKEHLKEIQENNQ